MKARMMHEQTRRNRWKTVGIGIACSIAALLPSAISASAASPAFIPPTAGWLATVNYYRAMAGVGPVSGVPAMSAGAAAHPCYMLYNGISHDETPGLPGYTPEGDAAANSGNVAVSSQINTSAQTHVDMRMS